MWSSQAFNQWALQPAMFNDVPHEQIDWAALAKQWIQMQHTQPGEEGPPGSSGLSLPQPHGVPNIPDKFQTENLNQPLLKTPVATDSYQRMPPEAEIPFIESENFLPKPPEESFWKGNWEGRPNNIDDRVWPAPPPPPPQPPTAAPPIPPMLPGKTTFDYGHMHDNPPLAMQTVDYNHVSDYSYNPMYPPPESHYDQYWSQVNVAPPPISPMFLKKERVSSSLHAEEDTSHIDAAKRKQLPAWIREGLEKMEQERLKRLEKEKADKEAAEKLSKVSSMKKMSNLLKADDSSVVIPTKSKFESDSDMEEESGPIPTKEIVKRRDTLSPIEDTRTEEEKKQELMLKVRRMLTEILLSVTNAEILSVAQEVYRKAVSRAPARQLASTTSLTTVASGLCGLASYGSESEASSSEEAEQSDSDDDLFQRIKEKRRQFAIKEKRIMAELERQELEEREEAERIKQEIFARISNKEVQKSDDANNSEAANSNSPEIPDIVDDPDPNPENSSAEVNEHTQAAKPQTNEIANKENESNSTESDSDSSSSSSSSSNDSNANHKADKKKVRSNKNKKEYKNKKGRRKSSSSSKEERKRRRSRSRDSEYSNRHNEISRSRGKHKSSSKKNKRSESSSSSSSSNTHRKYSSKSYNHHKRERSHSHERSKKRARSRSNSSSRHQHSSRSRSHKSSYSRRDQEKYAKRSREEKRHRHSQSPPRVSSTRLPKKYRTSRSPSSENESLGKKLKTKSRNR